MAAQIKVFPEADFKAGLTYTYKPRDVFPYVWQEKHVCVSSSLVNSTICVAYRYFDSSLDALGRAMLQVAHPALITAIGSCKNR